MFFYQDLQKFYKFSLYLWYYTLLLYFLKMVYGWMSVQPHFFGREKISLKRKLPRKFCGGRGWYAPSPYAPSQAAAGRVRTPPAMSVCPSACLSRVVCAREKKNANCPENFAAGEGGIHRHPMHRRKQGVLGAPPKCASVNSRMDTAATAKELVGVIYRKARAKPKGLVASYRNDPELNSCHQADILFLPKDPRHRKSYALVVVDVATRRVAARALSFKSAKDTLKALKNIYKVDPKLSPPNRFECDNGGEFKDVTRTWLESQGTLIRYGEPGRHQQQGLAERVNGILGEKIMKAQAARELQTGKVNRQWVKELPGFVDEINKSLERVPPPMPKNLPKPANDLDRNLLEDGTLVRRVLNRPLDTFGKVLPYGATKSGRRAGDATYERKQRAVKQLILMPGMSPRYILEGLPHVSFARYELLAAND